MTENGSNEVVVVTGASAGVGRAVAHAFARRGGRIGLVARGREGLEACRAEVEDLGGEALVLPTDDAMATIFARFTEVSATEFKRATEVTYLGAVYGTMAALKRMVPRDHGTVVQVGSALAYRAIPLQSAYCGAKFGIRGFTDSVRTELLHDKSRVWITMVQLPAVNTPQFNWCRTKLPDHPQPVPPIYQPEVPAETIYYAAHHRRREIYCGGTAVMAILGNKVLPALADRYLARTGFASQQMPDRPVSPGRQNNLFEPVPSEAAAHGIFDDKAKTRSYQARATTHRSMLAGAAVGTLAVGAGLGRLARR